MLLGGPQADGAGKKLAARLAQALQLGGLGRQLPLCLHQRLVEVRHQPLGGTLKLGRVALQVVRNTAPRCNKLCARDTAG